MWCVATRASRGSSVVWRVSLWAGLVLRLVCEVLVSVSCVSRLPPVSLNRYVKDTAHRWEPGHAGHTGTGAHGPCTRAHGTHELVVALAWRPLHARCAVLHDLDIALVGRLRRGRVYCLGRVAHARRRLSRLELIGAWALGAPAAPPPAACTRVRVCSARLVHFADCLRAGARRRSGSTLGAGGGRVGFAGGGLF